MSITRARQAIDNQLMICPECMSRVERNVELGTFEYKAHDFSLDACHVCEIKTKYPRLMFNVRRWQKAEA